MTAFSESDLRSKVCQLLRYFIATHRTSPNPWRVKADISWSRLPGRYAITDDAMSSQVPTRTVASGGNGV